MRELTIRDVHAPDPNLAEPRTIFEILNVMQAKYSHEKQVELAYGVLDIVETDAAVEAIIKFRKMLEARAIKNKVEAAEREQADVRPRVFEPAC